MDWKTINFDWNRARAFLVTAEEGSLAAAARALNMTQPTLGRQVAALEDELGVELFNRRGRGLELTPNGIMRRIKSCSIVLKRPRPKPNRSRYALVAHRRRWDSTAVSQAPTDIRTWESTRKPRPFRG